MELQYQVQKIAEKICFFGWKIISDELPSELDDSVYVFFFFFWTKLPSKQVMVSIKMQIIEFTRPQLKSRQHFYLRNTIGQNRLFRTLPSTTLPSLLFNDTLNEFEPILTVKYIINKLWSAVVYGNDIGFFFYKNKLHSRRRLTKIIKNFVLFAVRVLIADKT